MNACYQYYNLKLHEMIDMYSNYDNMHTNVIFYALICINNHIIVCVNCILLIVTPPNGYFWRNKLWSPLHCLFLRLHVVWGLTFQIIP